MKFFRRAVDRRMANSSWTIDTLKEHLESRVDALTDHVAAKLDYSEKAVDKAEQQMNARLAAMNEFRDQLKDQAARLATNDRLEEIKEAADGRLKSIEAQISNWQGRLLVLGGIWSIVIITITALINYLIRTVE
jgi:cysteinyl-tRNA synthetase